MTAKTGFLALGALLGVLGAKFLYSFPGPRKLAFDLGDKIAGIAADAPITNPEQELEFEVGQGTILNLGDLD